MAVGLPESPSTTSRSRSSVGTTADAGFVLGTRSGRTEQPVRLSIAPMVDVSDRDFRTFMRLLSSKCEVWTEMLVDQALVHNEEASQHLEQLIGFSAPEHPIVCQLGGHDPTKLAAAARIAHLRGYDEVNLNVGCPSSRVAGHGLMGVALMKTPELVRDCLRALENEVPYVSIKTRLGVDDLDTEDFTRSFLDTILPPLGSSPGAQQPYRVIMHCRKAWLQGLSPAENRTIPPLDYPRACRVLGDFGSRVRWTLNGGIETLWQAKDVLTSDLSPANLEGVMIGRAAYNNPCMLHDTDVYLYGCDENPASAQSRGALLEAYADYLHDRYPLESDSPLTPGTFATSLKPTLGTFANKSGNRAYRQAVDSLIKAHKRSGEVGPGDVIRMAMREMPEDVLWEPLPSTVDIEEAERAERERMADWQRDELERRRVQYAKKEATQRARLEAAKAFDGFPLTLATIMDVGMDLLFLHPRGGATNLGHVIDGVATGGRSPSQHWARLPVSSSSALGANYIGLLMIPIVILLAAMRSSVRKGGAKACAPVESHSSKKQISAVCGSVQGDGDPYCRAGDRELTLKVPAGIEERLELRRDSTFPDMSVVLEEGARLSLREYVDTGGTTRVYLGAGAKLVHVLHQTAGDCVTEVEHDEGSKYSQTRLVIPQSNEARHSTDIKVKGPDCVSDVHSVHVVARGSAHTESDSYCDFLSTGTKAQQTHRAVLCGPKSRSSWRSTYMVNKVAQQTDANQECKALLFDRTARMTARPELKIQADDVKVTHGAALSTTIDPKQLLYLISRGVPRSRAQWLCVNGFLEDTLMRVDDPEDREWLREKVKEAIADFEKKEDPLKFAFIADEYELRAFDNPFIKEIARTADGTTVSPPPLKAHLLRELGSEVLEGYIDKFNHNRVLYCKLGAFSRGWNLPKFAEVRLMFLADFEAHLSRKSSNDPFVLKAMKAEILEQDPGAGWPANPKLYGNRLRELLSGSRRAIPLIGEKAEDTCRRQLQFYSEYISPPAPGIHPDTWPLLKRMHPRSMGTPQHVKNIFNWLTNGTMKPRD
ncbi:hypothetical protein FOZ61_006102 [Perkinsus olseni]|uniref:Uncharacterized protein n=1 Tax=Perkinsus olseni TaxID=32597 RepID=A0A7J6MB80_PEROL|nr:hypothetical protein FOZ61_006102 [Perkinsus olseni]